MSKISKKYGVALIAALNSVGCGVSVEGGYDGFDAGNDEYDGGISADVQGEVGNVLAAKDCDLIMGDFPEGISLSSNPFNPNRTDLMIEIDTIANSFNTFAILDGTTIVRTLGEPDGEWKAGNLLAKFDGMDDNGALLPAGDNYVVLVTAHDGDHCIDLAVESLTIEY